MRVLGCRISDENKSMVIDWYEESEQSPQGGASHSTVITEEALEWAHVNYYYGEIVSDLEEMVGWFIKYQTGLVDD